MWFEADFNPQFDNPIWLGHPEYAPAAPFAADAWPEISEPETTATAPSPKDDGTLWTEEDEPIIVTGTRLFNPGFISGGGSGGLGGGGYGSDGGGGGSGATDSTPGDDLSHTANCSSAAGAADQIRDRILSTRTDDLPSTLSHERVEYGTYIIRQPDGTYGAAHNMIFSDSSDSYVDLDDNIPSDPSIIVGMIHNHPGSPSDDYFTNVLLAHPSPDDWASLHALVERHGVSASVASLWMIDAWGNLREFKYSDMEKWKNMSDQEKKDPANLPPPSEVQGCGS